MERIKCLICGMMVNEKNYNLNHTTFFDKNTQEEILRCPFCGVARDFLSNGEDYLANRSYKLENKTTKILDMAMKLELFNAEFYAEASMLANKEALKQLFKELSSIEWMHARVHKNLGGFKELPNLRKMDYSRHNTDELLLKEAHKREKHAIAFYNRYYEEVPNNLQKIFVALSNVEKEHMIITDNTKD